MLVSIPKEIAAHERRVAATPDSVKRLVALGFQVCVEHNAGEAAAFPDRLYEAAGATLTHDPWTHAALILKVRPPMTRSDQHHEVDLIPEGARLVCFLWPARNTELLERLNARNITALGMDQIPRISRAQKMDALSSMANIAGYRAVLEAAQHYGSFFCGQMTAAGTIAPAKVLVIGAGVAGLAALGAARGLGAVVRAFDTRAAVRDQVRSMGAEFIEVTLKEDGEGAGGYAREMSPAFIAAEMALFREQAREVDVVITTALIPGKPAPKLWLRDMVESMRPGSVVVDMGAESGGNCELTRADEVVVHAGVTILGPTDLPSRLATTASTLYANNVVHLLSDLKGSVFDINVEDEVIRGALVTHQGAVMWPAPKRVQVAVSAPVKAVTETTKITSKHDAGPAVMRYPWLAWGSVIVLLGAWAVMHFGMGATHEVEVSTRLFAERVTIFFLSCFVGWQVVWNVTPALHTPLMSVTNAISGIILLGGMLHLRASSMNLSGVLGVVAVLLAMINVSGGFMVTRRMLAMFKK
jgi:H+-translocating NAD(P) transhydrogenase subunit alpha